MFNDFRISMLSSTNIASEQDAIRSAFEETGITAAASVGSASGATSYPNGAPGSPAAPSWISATPLYSCQNNKSVYTSEWEEASNANAYDHWYSIDGSNFVYSFTVFGSPHLTENSADVDVKISSCNSVGCSNLSFASYFQRYLCD